MYFLNTSLLLIHIGFLVFFFSNAVYVMVYVNMFSMIVYAINFELIFMKKLRAYMTTTFMEVMLHMFFAILCVGTGAGFQLYYFACIAVIFYVEYMTSKLEEQPLSGLLLCIICGGLYFVSLFLAKTRESQYTLDDAVEFGILVVNSLLIFIFLAGFFYVMTRRSKNYEEELAKQALYDRLTNLYNRQYMVSFLDQMWKGGRTCRGWIAILDVDDFKKINDQYGHNCGDCVLEYLGFVIRFVCTRQVNCRWGGEEFLIFGENQNIGQAQEVLERLREAICLHPFHFGDDTVHVTATFGVQTFREEWTVEEWIGEADRKLYKGKCSGKNRVVS